MAKDPAVLFYTSDFLSGTFTMNYEQRGKYITLLCLQHQKGKLTDKDLKTILDDTDIDIFEKFIKLSDGYYYNMKLKNESERRKSYSESRRSNRMKNISKSYDESYVKHMETETGTETGTDNLKLETKTITDTTSIQANSIDSTTKEIINKFDDLFGDVK